MLGTYAVGKTSILHKFKHNQFKESSEPTLAIDYISQLFEIKGRDYKVQFWDTAGQEKYNNITSKVKVENQNQTHNVVEEGIGPINQKR